MESDDRLLEVFFEVQRGLPRQGPGGKHSTTKAFALCAELPNDPVVLDIGCGPGTQTMALAELCSGRIVAVDTCEEYLVELRERLQAANLANRVEAINADMSNLGLPSESFDLIWCEAAAYVIGIPKALELWHGLLRNGGYLAFSELVWTAADPPPPAVEFWQNGYPAMTDVEGVKTMIDHAGYELIGNFTLSNFDWWDEYYTPLEAKLPSLREKYEGDEQALSVVAMTEAEIEMRRKYYDSYGYQFFVVRKAA